MDEKIFERAATWIGNDPDARTQAELRKLVDAARGGSADAMKDLRERFVGPLEFGTAGLRGLLGAGESRMNRAVVLRTCAGLAAYLSKMEPRCKESGVVVGYDGRHLSREFADDTAAVLAAAGIPSHVSPRPCPTPLTAFAVTALGACAGVMVTASHNPPAYNGYKVYWGNGAQIIPPHDTNIAAEIEKIGPAKSVPRLVDSKLIHTLSDDIERRYLDAVRALSMRSDGDRKMAIAYTPLHGVGNRLTRRALAEAGFTGVTTVPEQQEPDGDFPTVAFPNPEEKGALDLAYALAKREAAHLVVANDPDVDRLAIAVERNGQFVQLTGNQVGVLLGHYVLTAGKKSDKRLALASIVSSPMLGVIAKALGVRYEETLTGFKWIANRAMDLEKQGYEFVFGYEEALGYTVGPIVRDKDGISAAVIMCELAAVLASEKKTLLDDLEALSRRYGLFVSGQRSLTMPGADGSAKIAAIMERLRKGSPEKIGAHPVLAIADYETGVRRARDGSQSKLELPSSNVLAYELEGGSRIIARPSGTEPKIKYYFDLREEMISGEPLAGAEARAQGKLKALADAFTAIASG